MESGGFANDATIDAPWAAITEEAMNGQRSALASSWRGSGAPPKRAGVGVDSMGRGLVSQGLKTVA